GDDEVVHRPVGEREQPPDPEEYEPEDEHEQEQLRAGHPAAEDGYGGEREDRAQHRPRDAGRVHPDQDVRPVLLLRGELLAHVHRQRAVLLHERFHDCLLWMSYACRSAVPRSGAWARFQMRRGLVPPVRPATNRTDHISPSHWISTGTGLFPVYDQGCSGTKVRTSSASSLVVTRPPPGAPFRPRPPSRSDPAARSCRAEPRTPDP